MDHSTIDTKVREYAEGLPESQREDFAQDMWVLLLAVILPQCPEGSSRAGSYLNLALFRARENWRSRQRHESRNESFDETTAQPDADPGADLQMEASEALRDLVASLHESFEDYEVEVILDGLRDGLTQKEIATMLGRTPQSFHYHMKKFRFAA